MSEEERNKNIIEEPSLDFSVQASLKTSFFKEGDWPNENWWEFFESEPLNKMMEEAFQKNPTIQEVATKIELARNRANRAKAKLYPLITFDGDGNWLMASKYGIQKAYNADFPKYSKLLDLTLNFTYEFDFWDKYRNLYRAELSLEMAEYAEYAQVKLITAAAVAKSYFALKANLIKQKIYQNLYEVRKKLFLLRTLLLNEAIDDLRIVLLTEEGVEESKKWLLAIEEEIEIDRHLINILLGKGPDSEIVATADLKDLPLLVIPDTLSVDLIARRPDLMAQIWRLESLANQVGAAKAEFFPNINLASFLGLSSVLYGYLFNASSYQQGIIPSFSLPVFTAGEIQANLDAKRSAYQAAVFAYNDMILKSAEEVVDALSFAKAVNGEKVQQELIVAQANHRLKLASDRLKSGLDNALETLKREEEVLQKELENTDLSYGRYEAAIALIRALGGGYQLNCE